MPSKFRFVALAALPLCALLPGCGVDGMPAKATVTTIDRTCTIIETTKEEVDDPRYAGHTIQTQKSNISKGECRSVDEWQEVRKKRTKDVDGTAVVHLDYQAPQDGSYHSASLTFTGRDEEFYKLNAGDTLDILVAKDDPARISKA